MIGMLEYGGSGMLGGARSAVMALGVDMHRVRRIGLGLLFAGHLGASERGALPSEIFDVQAMEGASMSTDVAEQADGRLLVANMRGLHLLAVPAVKIVDALACHLRREPDVPQSAGRLRERREELQRLHRL